VRSALTRAFQDAGLEAPALDARVLLQHAFAYSHADIAANAKRSLSAEESERVAALARRRLRREPIAYIVGEKEFWGLSLRVTPATLVPRADTETLVEAALEAIAAALARERPLCIADLGTGSGAILLALLSELPHAHGVGIDIDEPAVTIARANARRLGLARRTTFVVGDLTDPVGQAVDLLVSNPPYVETERIATLAADVRDHEPRGALDGGADGLSFYRRIAADAARILAPGGNIAVEIGEGQEGAVTDIFRRHGWEPAGPAKQDLSGVPRALAVRRR
jgi:release factor glutamine methyltransferase